MAIEPGEGSDSEEDDEDEFDKKSPPMKKQKGKTGDAAPMKKRREEGAEKNQSERVPPKKTKQDKLLEELPIVAVPDSDEEDLPKFFPHVDETGAMGNPEGFHVHFVVVLKYEKKLGGWRNLAEAFRQSVFGGTSGQNSLG